MHILIVEDQPEQQELACQAVEKAGHTLAVCGSLRYSPDQAVPYGDPDYEIYKRADLALLQADGVITDLHFLPDTYSRDECERYGLYCPGPFDPPEPKDPSQYTGSLPPCGLLVVIDCLVAGKPVVICTSGYHHGPAMSWIYDRYLTGFGRREAFGWNDRKDWEDAVRQLEERYAAQSV